MMEIGCAPVSAATPLILRGFLLPQARDAAARRLSRKFKDPFAKTRYTYVYRSECAASPKELPGFGFPPGATGTRLGAAWSGIRTIAVIAAGVAFPAVIKV